LSEGDGGVTHKTDSPHPLGIITVENEYSKVNADLGSGEASAIRSRVRCEHVCEQCLQGGTEIRHLSGGRVHDRFTPSHDGQYIPNANQLFYGHFPPLRAFIFLGP
jgi:hypothetical protein